MKILLVDDHPLFLEGLKILLTLRGIEVVGTARDGLEELKKARAIPSLNPIPTLIRISTLRTMPCKASPGTAGPLRNHFFLSN